MKILYIAHMRLPTERAHGYAIMKLCEEFARAGHNVELLTPSKKAEKLEEDPFAFYGIERNFILTRVRSTDFLGARENGGRLSFWLDQISFMLLVKLFYSSTLKEADIIYVRDYRLVPFLPAEKATLEVHDIPAHSASLINAANKVQHVVAISQGLKEAMIRLGVRKEILVAPDAVDLENFSNLPVQLAARQELGLQESGNIALYTGHFYDWKGADVFAQAATYVPEVQCVLVGGVEPDFSFLKEKYGGAKNLTLLSSQPHPRVAIYLAAADVLILPNRSDSEISARYTSPLKLFEYMAAGKPIVASDLPSIREILDESTAVLVRPDNSQALADGIKEVLGDKSLAEKLAAAAKAKVQEYTWGKRTKNILNFVIN